MHSRPMSELAELNPTADEQSGDTLVTVVPMAAVAARSGRVDTSRVARLDATQKGLRPLRTGDVLFAKITPSMENGKIAVAPRLTNDHGVASTEFHVIRPGPELDARFLVHLLQTPTVRSDARRNMKGTVGQLRVPESYLAQLRIRVPATEVQEQLADRLDAIASQLHQGVEGLNDLLTKLASLRRAILDDYWPGAAPVHPKSRNEHQSSGNGWRFQSIRELIRDADYGTSEKCDHTFRGPPVVRIPNVIDGRLDLTDLKYADEHFRPAGEEALQPGDLLVVRTNGSRNLIGRAALVEEPLAKAHYHASYLIRLRFSSLPIARWVAQLWDASAVRRTIVGFAATSAGQYNVSLRELTAIQVPIPSEPDISALTEVVRARTAELTALRSGIELAIKRASRFRDAASQALLGEFLR